jgi:hypothetical protein
MNTDEHGWTEQEKGAIRSEAPRWQGKTEGGCEYKREKGLANQWNRKNIVKQAHVGRGQETIWEMSFYWH